MSESKHTPGPWKVGDEIRSEKRLVYIRIEHDGAESSLSNTSVYPQRRDGTTFAAQTRRELGENRPVPHVSDEECRANARLIAAAPKMLEALRAALGSMDCLKGGDSTEDKRGCECGPCQDRAKVRAAISAATGGEQ